MHTQILVLGSGPAGFAAALYAALAGFSTTILSGDTHGGQLTLTHRIENYPGFPAASGLDLIEAMQRQALTAGARLMDDRAVAVDLSHPPFSATTGSGQVITADSVIIAMGASPRWLGAPGESHFRGHGVSVCATCDGVFYRGKTVAVIGGGSSAAYEALFLAQTSHAVLLIYREAALSAEDNLVRALADTPNIQQIANTQVLAFLGDTKLDRITVQNIQTATETTLAIDGVFEAIGHMPNTRLFQGQLDLDSDGYLLTDCRTGATSCDGVFACGDIQAPLHRQAIIAAGAGCTAALSAKAYLKTRLKS